MAACASNISRGCITVGCKSMPTPRRGSAMSTSVSIPETKTFHMTPDEFRKRGYAVVDWIADYYARLETFPVLSRVEPGAIRRSLPKTAPVAGEAFETILAEVEKLILPGITHWQRANGLRISPPISAVAMASWSPTHRRRRILRLKKMFKSPV